MAQPNNIAAKDRLNLQLREVFVHKDSPEIRRWAVTKLSPTQASLTTIGAGDPLTFRKTYIAIEQLLKDGTLIPLSLYEGAKIGIR